MYKARLFYTSLAFLLLFFPSLLARPGLNVVALVDGMRTEDIVKLLPYLNRGGLRTVCEEGKQVNVELAGEVYGGAETVISMLSGTSPSENGISMEYYMSPQDNELHYALEDKTEAGIVSTLQLSPRPILTPVVADYFRMDYGKDARIFSVGIDPQTTIALAGHSANGCCWLDETARKWATTTYYKDGLPLVADELNANGSIEALLTEEWKPRLSINMYNSPTQDELQYGFSYMPTQYPLSTPAINTLVVNLALELQRHYNLGKAATPDMLLLEFSVLPPMADGDFITSAIAEDMYLHLNQAIGILLDQLEKRLGAGQVQLSLIGLPRLGISPTSLTQMGMPVKLFSTERAAALSSAYLMALYGHEKWVLGGYGNTIFLNRQLIERQKLSLSTMQEQVADLLTDFEAVLMAYPARQACEDPIFCHSLAKHWTGDVVFRLQSGWQLAYNEQLIIDRVWERRPVIPFFIYGSKMNSIIKNDGLLNIKYTDLTDYIRKTWTNY